MITIAVAVVLRCGEVLVGRRSAEATDAAGCAEFPGGKVEPDETAEDAAARECLEESGIAVRIGSVLDRAYGHSSAGPLEILFFAATPLDDRAEALPPFAWVRLADLGTLRFPAANDGVLTHLGQGGS